MTGLFDDIFKRSKHQVVRDNAVQGKDGEERIKRDYECSGYKVKRTGRGHDYKATKRDWLSGKKETKYIEVKTGNGKLSPLQKKKKRSLGKKYVVERVQPNPFTTSTSIDLLGSSESKPKRKTKKKSTKRKTTKKKPSSNIFGSSRISLLGSSEFKSKRKTKKVTKKRTKRKSNLGLFGSGVGDVFDCSLIVGNSSKRKRTRKKSTTRKRKTRKKKNDPLSLKC